jgi:diaminohydroxyphosphoribosylaminopyrimidine deaminase/5-amino-6-(5-phosphoribosylamino)uracil reductase
MNARYMQRAIELAERGRGRTSPNPMVGAVIVKEGEIVGEGFHEKAGEAHAEINALIQAQDRSRKAIMYVTLEPCCFYGRTPPCTEAIEKAGIEKVIIGMVDPNPRVSGKGIEAMEREGITVESGFLAEEIAFQNEIYLKYITTGTPFVQMKGAMSLDGKIAAGRNERTAISGKKSREAVHILRDQFDAIVVGVGTVLVDDPMLTVRINGCGSKNPLRIVVDSSLRIPVSSRIVATASYVRTLIVYAEADGAKKRRLAAKGLEILEMPDEDGKVDLIALMKELGRREISSVLWEGGAVLNAAALKAGIVDKLVLFIAPFIIGNPQAPSLVEDGHGQKRLPHRFRISDACISGGDLVVEAYPTR